MNRGSAIGPSADVKVNTRLVAAHAFAAFGGLLVSALFGLLVSIKFNAPEFLSQHAWSTWGRLRYDHTQGILYAWLGNAFIAFMYYAVPYLTRRPITREGPGCWLLFFCLLMPILCGRSLILTRHHHPPQ